MSQIQCVGIVGAGMMGTGIAEVAAAAGIPTVVVKATPGALDGARAGFSKALAHKVEKGRLDASTADEILGRIDWTTERERLALADIVIECIVEDLPAKQRLFADLEARVPEGTIFASNTSTLRIADIAKDCGRKGRMIGMHFFSPVPAMKLVELAHLPATRPEVLGAAAAFIRTLGKTAVPVLDSMGLVVNRLLLPYLIGAISAYEQGLARPEEIDTAMRLGCGHPVGPLALADVIGLDVVYTMAKLLHAEFQDPRYQPPAILRRLVQAGQLGKKAKLGFYDYATEPPRANGEIWELVRGSGKEQAC